jgi:hypothetical protein
MPDGEIEGELPLEQMLGEVLLNTCPAETLDELETEIEVLMGEYAEVDDPVALVAAAEILEKQWDVSASSRTHLRLWAALLRRRAVRAA